MPGKLFFWGFDEATDCMVLTRISAGAVTAVATVSPNKNQVCDRAVLTIGGTPKLLGGHVFFNGGQSPQWEPDSTDLRSGCNTFRDVDLNRLG